MLVRNWEAVALLEAPGTIQKLGAIALESPFVIGVESASAGNYYHYQLSQIEGSADITRATIELPRAKTERLSELFRRLYSDERTPPPEYDCRAGLDFLIGASEDVAHVVNSYNIRGPMQPDSLEPGEPYMVLDTASSTTHDFLAADNTTALHVAGPGGGLGHTPAADLMRVWEGSLQKITGWTV